MTEQQPLRDKIAVVTGAGRGIGRAIAIGFADAGAAVCCAARTESEIRETENIITGRGNRAISKITDVTDLKSCNALCDAAQDVFGGIDIVVVNAGITTPGQTVADSDPDRWRAVIDVNLIGAYHTVKAAVPHLRRRGGGKIIIIGSGLGHRGAPETSAYACSKAGVWMLTRILAQEHLKDNISVNELIPGPVLTDLTDQDEDALRAQLGSREWIKQPEDVVPLALYLATQPDNGPTAQSMSLMRRDC